MIQFKEELNKFKPCLEVDGIEEAIQGDEMQDLLDLLQQITKQIQKSKEKE